MNRSHEQLLVATLAGLILVSVAAFAVTPAAAAGYDVDQKAQITGVAWWDHLNVRKWPAHYSVKVGEYQPDTWVWVERCVTVENASDWCKVENGHYAGWVSASYLSLYDPMADDEFGYPQGYQQLADNN